MEGSLKGVGVGCPFVLKDEPVRRKISLAEQGAFATAQGKRIYDLWEKVQATQQEYKDVINICTEKNR